MNRVHDFAISLAASHAAADLPIWEEVYRAAFPDFRVMVDHREDGEHQRAGIDRSVILANGKQLLIDEKIRFKDYGDIALEYWSNKERKTRGWVCKPQRADFIAYAIAPSGHCYLLPVPQLRLAWVRHHSTWVKQYRPPIIANNGLYSTVSVGVPIQTLMSALVDALDVRFSIAQQGDLFGSNYE